jgi:hypothetical protein
MQALFQLSYSPRDTSEFHAHPRKQAFAAMLLKFAIQSIVGNTGKRKSSKPIQNVRDDNQCSLIERQVIIATTGTQQSYGQENECT